MCSQPSKLNSSWFSWDNYLTFQATSAHLLRVQSVSRVGRMFQCVCHKLLDSSDKQQERNVDYRIWVDNEMSENEHSRSLRKRNKHHRCSSSSWGWTWKLKHRSLLSLDDKWGLLTCTETCLASYEVISDAWLCLERKHQSSQRERMTNDTRVWAEGGGGCARDDDGVYLSLGCR